MIKANTDLHVLAAWLRNRGVEVSLFEHPGMVGIRRVLAALPQLAGLGFGDNASEWQIHATGPKGKLSVIRGGTSLGDYEIYALGGDLFDDIRRYDNVKDAGAAIAGVLATGTLVEDEA